MFEREYRDLSSVPRWGIVPVIRRQSVAEHSYYVTLYAHHICWALGLDERTTLQVLRHCLEHDREECFTSDIPGPVKRSITDPDKEENFVNRECAKRFELSDFKDKGLVLMVRKLADLMDEYAYWNEEDQLGNKRGMFLLGEVSTRLYLASAKLSLFSAENVIEKVLAPFFEAQSLGKILPENNSDVAP